MQKYWLKLRGFTPVRVIHHEDIVSPVRGRQPITEVIYKNKRGIIRTVVMSGWHNLKDL